MARRTRILRKEAKTKDRRIPVIISIALILTSLIACSPDNGNAGGEGISDSGNVAIVYFSATGNTERVAGYIADETGGSLIEIIPADPYSNADLDWTNNSSRVNEEHNNYDTVRPGIQNDIDLSGYDTVFLGYPLWWGDAPAIVLTFLDNEYLSGKTIIPFCTSSSSQIGDSASNLENYEGNGNWLDGRRFRSGASENSVRTWLQGLGY